MFNSLANPSVFPNPKDPKLIDLANYHWYYWGETLHWPTSWVSSQQWVSAFGSFAFVWFHQGLPCVVNNYMVVLCIGSGGRVSFREKRGWIQLAFGKSSIWSPGLVALIILWKHQHQNILLRSGFNFYCSSQFLISVTQKPTVLTLSLTRYLKIFTITTLLCLT